MNWARNSWASVGLRGSSGDVGGARSCALLVSNLLGKESVFPRRPSTDPTRTSNTENSLFFDGGSMLAIGDTVTTFAVHGVVATETVAHDQRVRSVHGYTISPSLCLRSAHSWSVEVKPLGRFCCNAGVRLRSRRRPSMS